MNTHKMGLRYMLFPFTERTSQARRRARVGTNKAYRREMQVERSMRGVIRAYTLECNLEYLRFKGRVLP